MNTAYNPDHTQITLGSKRASVFLKDIAEQLGTVHASNYLIMRLPIALSEGASIWTVNAEAGRKGNARPF